MAEKFDPSKVSIRFAEATQRATNGGSPLDNDGGVEHGTPLVIAHKRDLVAFLLRVQEAIDSASPVFEELAETIKALDTFIIRVSPKERPPKA